MVERVQYRQHAGVLVEMEGVVCLTGQPEDQLRVGGLGEWEDEEEGRVSPHQDIRVISLAAINSGGGGGSKARQIQLSGW